MKPTPPRKSGYQEEAFTAVAPGARNQKKKYAKN